MKLRLYAAAIAIFVVLWAPFGHAQTTPIKTLVLYDAPTTGPYQKLSFAYAIMLRNLLGHWNTNVELAPVEQYASGQIEQYDATFYLGGIYDNQIPVNFLGDVFNTQKTVVWLKYNLWQFAWNPNFDFAGRYGFGFSGLRGMNGAPTAANPAPGFFDTIDYKGNALVKFYSFTNGAIQADPDIGITSIVDPAKATQVVTVRNPKTAEQAPYVIRSGNFWYFADMPFSYIGPRDRYLVFCDLLHDILNVPAATQHRAMVRLEDVGALVLPSTMRRLSDWLFNASIPFSIAVIPFYRDPLGVYNDGAPMEVHLAQATRLKNALNYAVARGGKIVMHGYTHQYASKRNLHTAVSGDDFEFWDAADNTPVLEDSEAWAGARLDAGRLELVQNGYPPFAWEAPHYQSSPKSIRAAAQRFLTTYQRVVYYTSDTPNLDPNSSARDFAVGQFYPYIIERDYYGQRVLPENLGNIEYDISDIDPTSNFNYTWQDLRLNAQMGLVVRDGFASFFFHPFWLDPEIGTPGFADFKRLMNAITTLGYTWVDASTLTPPVWATQ
ncbi:MAG TPA: DUF2334 domain-containing protein [Burkholderiales bacterium]